LVNHKQLDAFKENFDKNLITIYDQAIKESETTFTKQAIQYEDRLKVLERKAAENVQYSVFNVSICI